ncbi:hypothetical protein BH11BAC5_BH11BAC5_40370 [soil metagenome]
MKAISTILTITFTFFVAAVNAQTKFTFNNNEETISNIAALNTIGNNSSELQFERNANGASIQWQTAKESNTSHFELQISYDNQTFETIKKIAASDVTAWLTNYKAKFSRTYLSEEKVFYRIKTVFNNGDEVYTNSSAFTVTIGNEMSYVSIH